MSDIAVQIIRYRVLTYYDQSYPPDVIEGPPPEPPETPVIDQLDPTSITAGGTGDEVIVSGSGFRSSSVVWADEAAQPTTYVSAVTLTYQAQADQAGTQTITVRTGAEVSNAVELTVTAAAVQAEAAPQAAQEQATPDPGDSQPSTDPPSTRRRRT